MFSAFIRAGEKAKASGHEYFTVIEQQAPLRIALKMMFGSWVAYKIGGQVVASGERFARDALRSPPTRECLRAITDTLLLDSSLQLARGRHESSNAEGVRRLDKWHTSGTPCGSAVGSNLPHPHDCPGAHHTTRSCVSGSPWRPACGTRTSRLTEVSTSAATCAEKASRAIAEKGGVEILLNLLKAREATTRLTALDVLVRMAPLGASASGSQAPPHTLARTRHTRAPAWFNGAPVVAEEARGQLVDGNAAARAEASCDAMGDGPASERCQSLVAALKAALAADS